MLHVNSVVEGALILTTKSDPASILLADFHPDDTSALSDQASLHTPVLRAEDYYGRPGSGGGWGSSRSW